jgi:hypothetical protein
MVAFLVVSAAACLSHWLHALSHAALQYNELSVLRQ